MLILVKTRLFFILWKSLILLNSITRSFRKGGAYSNDYVIQDGGLTNDYSWWQGGGGCPKQSKKWWRICERSFALLHRRKKNIFYQQSMENKSYAYEVLYLHDALQEWNLSTMQRFLSLLNEGGLLTLMNDKHFLDLGRRVLITFFEIKFPNKSDRKKKPGHIQLEIIYRFSWKG